MVNLKIGGVPEHFNYPWYLTLKDKKYIPKNISLRWQDFPGGTGEMCAALRSKDVDIAIVLTEGIIKDIANGNPSKIVQTFVKSPLVWGIHVAANSKFNTVNDLKNATIAISRYGSGSHLMAIVNAYNLGWDISKLKFKVVGNLEGGITALSNGTADYFMWEHFTTKPYVDKGIFKRLADCPTPWPCFVIAVREDVLNKYPEEVKAILNIINAETSGFKSLPNLANTLSIRYNQKVEDIKAWLKITKWNSKTPITKHLITRIQNKMVLFNVIDKKIKSEKLIKKL
jgi:ABC-type nitrate/sulfonate/bicarbonate transport systems, periplasmic components